jgi:hypothetical protein
MTRRLLRVIALVAAAALLPLVVPGQYPALAAEDGAADRKRYEQRFRWEWPKTDFARHRVPPDEIVAGGPPRDGIPSIDRPKYATLEGGKATGWLADLDPQEPVISLSINGDVRAYPLRILTWHEIVNDVVGGEPVAVTYCPLCNSSLVFSRMLKGRVLDFGTTGLLRHSDLVMYDRQTETWWQQFVGKAIVGTLAGERLDILPSRLESYAAFQERHPGGRVLIPENPEARDYGRNPYVGYDSLAEPYFFSGNIDVAPHRPMDRVVATVAGGRPVAIPISLLRDREEIAVGDILVKWFPGQRSALDTRDIAAGREVGNVVVTRGDGNADADVPYHVTFAFAFRAFHPEGEILQAAP